MSLIKTLKSITPDIVKKFILQYIYARRARDLLGSEHYCAICEHHFDSFISLASICNGKFVNDVDINGTMHKVDAFEKGGLSKTSTMYVVEK